MQASQQLVGLNLEAIVHPFHSKGIKLEFFLDEHADSCENDDTNNRLLFFVSISRNNNFVNLCALKK
jgi:hypothetical protein